MRERTASDPESDVFAERDATLERITRETARPIAPPQRLRAAVLSRIHSPRDVSIDPALVASRTSGPRVVSRAVPSSRGPYRRARALGFWRGVAAAASVAAVALGVRVASPPPAQQGLQVALLADAGAAPAFVLLRGVSPGELRLRPLRVAAPGSDRALELWLVPRDGAPRSLGLLSGSQTNVIRLPRGSASPDEVAAFAVSLEPSGGSPTGAPTGPVLYQGAVTDL